MKNSPLWYKIIYSVILLLMLAGVTAVYGSGYPLIGTLALLLTGITAYLFGSLKAYNYRYLYPSLLAFGIFVITPLVYTVFIAFTNYSDSHRQTEKEIRTLLLSQVDVDVDHTYGFKLYSLGSERYQIELEESAAAVVQEVAKESVEGDSVQSSAMPVTPKIYISKPFKLPSEDAKKITAVSAAKELELELESKKRVLLKELINLQDRLKKIEVKLSDSRVLAFTSLKSFAPVTHVWKLDDNGESLIRYDGTVISPDKSGYFIDSNGTRHGPGFQAWVGAKNFVEVFTNPDIRKPFVKVFTWTITFAVLTLLSIFILGFTLAVILQAPSLKGRAVWRTLLIIPYAVPAFISILIFKGLFNPQFGEINALLTQLFGIATPPDWFTNPLHARIMVLLVNLWLGYPYMMIVCMGILQSIPSDIYEASAIDNGNPFSDAVKLTLPLILPPLKPLLITIFAFNFNNFLLINLLTNGAPQMPGAGLVGETDLLVTYTYNLAFLRGNNYALASAISVMIFIIVGTLSYLNLKMTMKSEGGR